MWWRPGEPLSEAGDRDTLTSYIQIGKDRWSRLQQLYLHRYLLVLSIDCLVLSVLFLSCSRAILCARRETMCEIVAK